MKKSIAIIGVGLLVFGSVNSAQADTTIRVAHVHSPDSPAGKTVEILREKIEMGTEARVTVQVFPSSQLGDDRSLFSSVRSGSVDVALTPYPMMSDIIPELSVYVAGYLFDDFQQQQEILAHPDLGMTWAGRLTDEGGVRVLCSFLYGTRQLTTTNKPVRSREDLAGLKIRAVPHPTSMSVVRGLGATPTPVPFSEIFQGLQQGVIDGQENPLATIDSQRIYEVQGYLVLTSHQLVALPIVINENTWQDLGEDQQAVQAAADESCAAGTELTIAEEARLIEVLAERGMQVIKPEDGMDIEAFREAVRAEVAKEFDGEIWPAGTLNGVNAALGR